MSALLEPGLARTHLDQKRCWLVGRVLEAMKGVLRGNGLLTGMQGVLLLPQQHFQGAFQDLEMLVVGLVVMGRRSTFGATSISTRVRSPPVSSLVWRKVA